MEDRIGGWKIGKSDRGQGRGVEDLEWMGVEDKVGAWRRGYRGKESGIGGGWRIG